jgi:hypothetical protein
VIRRTQLLLALAIVGAAACGDRSGNTPIAAGESSILDSADQVAFGSRTLVTDAGLLRAEIFADTTLFLDQSARISMRVVNGDFFNALGAKDAAMIADRATYDSRTENLEAWGNVVITSVDGRVLKSPMIKFDSRMNQISSDSAFVLTEADGREMKGVGFRADPNLEVITVLRLDQGRGGAVNLANP